MATGPAPMRDHSRTNSTNADGFRRLEVITGVGRRRRWGLEEKARIVAESLDPANTASVVARRCGLHVSQLFTWRQQLQRKPVFPG
jgi:transposase